MTLRLKTQLAPVPTSLALSPAARLPVWHRFALLLVGGTLAAIFGSSRFESGTSTGSPEERVTELLAREQGLNASPSDVHFIDPPPPWWQPWHSGRAWVLAGATGAYDDVYLVHTRRSPEGRVLGVTELFNLTATKATGEHHLTTYGHQAAWLSANTTYQGTGPSDPAKPKPEFLRLMWADVDSSQDFEPGLTFLQRLQWHLAWLQQYGEWSGVARTTYKLLPVAPSAWLALDESGVELITSNGKTHLSSTETTRAEGQHVAKQPVAATAKPGNLVTWAVDRFRQASWFGDTNMQRLKAVAYRAWDIAQRRLGVGTKDDAADFDLGDIDDTNAVPAVEQTPIADPSAPSNSATPPHTAIARPWPPKPLQPLLTPTEPHEGEWLSLKNDPFIKPTTDALGLFFTTFLRTDPERTFSRIIITTWDPLTVDLHTQSGTEEPKTATGETGSGLVPRERGLVEGLVAAFNGGFQATHGDFGMMADGTVYVPPLPYGATVAVDVDGRVGFGTWPAEVNGNAVAIPEHIRGLRQNLTPLVANGVFNPYQRTWWGGVPSGWEDDTRTVRSGICRTKSGLVSYFYGAKVDAENLAKAMLANDCEYGLHLDMNQGHTGLEFYHVAPTAELPPLALTLQSMWQAEGAVSDTNGLSFRGRRLFRAMQLMNFPRYIQREARDFFYLTARPLLPRSNAKTDAWYVPETLRHTFPPPLALRHLSTASTPPLRVNLVEIDPNFVAPKPTPSAPSLEVLRLTLPEVSTANDGIWWNSGRFTRATATPQSEATLVLNGSSLGAVDAMACIHPATGTLLLAEAATGTANPGVAEQLTTLLKDLGCEGQPLPLASLGLSLNAKDLNGHPAETTSPHIGLFYRHPERSFALFPDTKVVPVAEWKPLQTSK